MEDGASQVVGGTGGGRWTIGRETLETNVKFPGMQCILMHQEGDWI